MKKVRRQVFETNSSATHALEISKDVPSWLNTEAYFVPRLFRGKLRVSLLDTGDESVLQTLEDKVAYYLTLMAGRMFGTGEADDMAGWYGDMESTDEYQQFEKDLIEEFGKHGVDCKGLDLRPSYGTLSTYSTPSQKKLEEDAESPHPKYRLMYTVDHQLIDEWGDRATKPQNYVHIRYEGDCGDPRGYEVQPVAESERLTDMQVIFDPHVAIVLGYG